MRLPSFTLVVTSLAAAAALASVGCGGPPKVLIEHSYATSDKSVETFIQRSGASVGSGKDKTELFNVFVRVCNQEATNTMGVCKDTLILENVNPRSL